MRFLLYYPDSNSSTQIPIEDVHGMVHHPKTGLPLWTTWLRGEMALPTPPAQGIVFTDPALFNLLARRVLMHTGKGVRRACVEIVPESHDVPKEQHEATQSELAELRAKVGPAPDLAEVLSKVKEVLAEGGKLRFGQVAETLHLNPDHVKQAILAPGSGLTIANGGWIGEATPAQQS